MLKAGDAWNEVEVISKKGLSLSQLSLKFHWTREYSLQLVYVQVRAEHVEVRLPASSTSSKF